MLKSVVEPLACWQGKFGCHHNNILWMAVPPCFFDAVHLAGAEQPMF